MQSRCGKRGWARGTLSSPMSFVIFTRDQALSRWRDDNAVVVLAPPPRVFFLVSYPRLSYPVSCSWCCCCRRINLSLWFNPWWKHSLNYVSKSAWRWRTKREKRKHTKRRIILDWQVLCPRRKNPVWFSYTATTISEQLILQ